MDKFIRYKDRNINLNAVISVWLYDTSGDCYNIGFVTIGEEQIKIIGYTRYRWVFEFEEERNKVYNYILNTYFTDIEKEITK